MIFYLSNPDAERLFSAHAYAYSLSLLQPTLMKNQLAFNSWHDTVGKINEQTYFAKSNFAYPVTAFGTWSPRKSNPDLIIYAGILLEEMKKGGKVSVCAVLKDDKNKRSDRYEKEWNAFLQFSNVMQFLDEYIAVSTTGLEKMVYLALPTACETSSSVSECLDEGWDAVLESLFDEASKTFAKAAKEAGIPAPSEDDIGYEVFVNKKATDIIIEIAWPEIKVGYLTDEQAGNQETLEKDGWIIIDLMNIKDVKKMFGGKDE